MKQTAPTRCVSLDGVVMADLVEDLAARGVGVRFIARGGSMSPWIRDGDVLVVTPVRLAVLAGPGEPAGTDRTNRNASGTSGARGTECRSVSIGDIVAFRRPGSGRLTVHRLVGRTNEGWIARGDRHGETDGIIAESEIFGIVTRVERRGLGVFVPRGVTALLLAGISRVVLGARHRMKT